MNGALAALSGLPPEDHIGRTFHEMLPRVAQSVETELRQVLTTGKFFAGGVVEAETSAASGVKQAFQHSAAAVWGEDNEIIGLSCLVHDVTSQRRTRDALQQSEESLELSLDAAPIGTWSWDLIDDTHFWDSRMLSMSGHSAEEYTGVMSDDFMASLHPDDVAKVEEAVRRSLEDGAEYNIDYRIIRRNDGEVRDMNARALVIRDDGGKAVRMTGVAIDVTERKRSEAKPSYGRPMPRLRNASPSGRKPSMTLINACKTKSPNAIWPRRRGWKVRPSSTRSCPIWSMP